MNVKRQYFFDINCLINLQFQKLRTVVYYTQVLLNHVFKQLVSNLFSERQLI